VKELCTSVSSRSMTTHFLFLSCTLTGGSKNISACDTNPKYTRNIVWVREQLLSHNIHSHATKWLQLMNCRSILRVCIHILPPPSAPCGQTPPLALHASWRRNVRQIR